MNPEVLKWARESAGLSEDQAATELGLRAGRGKTAAERLRALEAGQPVTRPTLLKMAKVYRRPLITFYLNAPPPKGFRGEDFRNLPDPDTRTEPLVDALVRDIRARQSILPSGARARDLDEEAPLPPALPCRSYGFLEVTAEEYRRVEISGGRVSQLAAPSTRRQVRGGCAASRPRPFWGEPNACRRLPPQWTAVGRCRRARTGALIPGPRSGLARG